MTDRLGRGIKLAYASGTITFAVKDVAFINFVLFYYRQVLGVSGKLAGLALLIAMISDALSDPIIGSISDRFHSRWGRRHPFMVAGTLPLALVFFALFRPPAGLSELQLFVWLTVVAVALRTFLTIFYIPYLALGAELSTDYQERSSVTTYRTTVGWIVALLMYWAVMRWVFAAKGDVDGRLVAENYQQLALWSFLLIVVFATLCVAFTRQRIPFLPQAAPGGDGGGSTGLVQIGRDLWSAMGSRNFRVMFAVMFSAYMLLGIFPAVAMHMGTYFWEFTTNQMGTVGLLMITANLTIFAVMDPLSRRIEKHRLLQIAFLGYGTNLVWFVGLRLLGVLPENGHPLILVLYFVYSFLQTSCMMMIHILPPSLLADIVDEQELETGQRQEGVFFAAQSFSAKAVSGFGTLFGGWVLDFAGLPEKVLPGQVPSGVLFRMGLIVGPVLGCLFLIPFVASLGFRLSRAKHAEISRALLSRSETLVAAPPAGIASTDAIAAGD